MYSTVRTTAQSCSVTVNQECIWLQPGISEIYPMWDTMSVLVLAGKQTFDPSLTCTVMQCFLGQAWNAPRHSAIIFTRDSCPEKLSVCILKRLRLEIISERSAITFLWVWGSMYVEIMAHKWDQWPLIHPVWSFLVGGLYLESVCVCVCVCVSGCQCRLVYF